MKIALPISHLITRDNYNQIPCDVFELRCDLLPISIIESIDMDTLKGKELCWHSSMGCMKNTFESYFSDWAKRWGDLIPLFSCTLGPAVRDYSIEGWRYKAAYKTEIMTKCQIHEQFLKTVQKMKDCYGGKIAFELTNGYPFPEYNHVCEPEFVSCLLIDADVGLLVDLAHIDISCYYMNMLGLDYYNK